LKKLSGDKMFDLYTRTLIEDISSVTSAAEYFCVRQNNGPLKCPHLNPQKL
jgi:hypothetical protein